MVNVISNEYIILLVNIYVSKKIQILYLSKWFKVRKVF